MPWQSPGGAFSRFFFYLQSPRALALCSDPGGDTSPSAGGPPRTPPLDGAALWTPSGNCRGPLSFSALQARGALGFLPGLAGQGVPADPTAPASLQARPGTPRDPRGTSGPDFEFFALQARGAPAACQSLLSPLGALSRSGPGGRGSPRTPAPGPAPARPGTPSGGPPGAPRVPLGPDLSTSPSGTLSTGGPAAKAPRGPGLLLDFEKFSLPRLGTTRRTAGPLGPGLKHLSVGHSIDRGPRAPSAAGSWPSPGLCYLAFFRARRRRRSPGLAFSGPPKKGCSLTSGRSAGGPRAGPGVPPDKRLDRGLTLNRSRSYSRSATYETLTQNQVVYESFGAKLFTNMKCAVGGGPPSFGDPPAR